MMLFAPCTGPSAQCGSPSQPATPATTGALDVVSGFSAASTAACTGGVTITITPQAMTGHDGQDTASTVPLGYGGFSSMIDAQHQGCQVSQIFTSLRTGTWRISDGLATCTATVTAGNATTIRIWNHVCGA